MERFRAADLINAPVQRYSEAIADEQARANGYITELAQADGSSATIAGSPVVINGAPSLPRGPAPELGEHTEAVLLGLGYTWEQIAALRGQGVI